MTYQEFYYFVGWLVLLGVMGAGLWRVARGPTLFDRIIGFDTLVIGIIGCIVLFSLHGGTGEYLELILVVTALGFLTTVSYYYYLSQGAPPRADKAKEDES